MEPSFSDPDIDKIKFRECFSLVASSLKITLTLHATSVVKFKLIRRLQLLEPIQLHVLIG